MTDTFTQTQRSAVMRAVKSRGNQSTEIKLMEIFKERGIRGWRRNSNLFGKPDFIFPQKKIALFADGCFWHGHPCRNVNPSQNADYWAKKIARNKVRDKAVTKILKQKGWTVIRLWECRIKKGDIKKLMAVYECPR